MNQAWRRTPRVVTPRQGLAITAAVIASGMVAAGTGPLYAQTYPIPGPGSNVITPEQFVTDFQNTFADARVDWETRPERVVVNEPAEVDVTLVVGVDPGGPEVPQVRVAWDNEAVLTPERKGAFEVFPAEAQIKSLDRCQPRADGGCTLAFDWTVVPRLEGPQVLLLTVSPLVYVDGQLSEKFKRSNADIAIDVLVHPAQEAFDAASLAMRSMEVVTPATMTAGSAETVSASFERTWDDTVDVTADITLARGSDSSQVRIEEAVDAADDTGDVVSRTWEVEPTESGVVDLVFTAEVSTQAGDVPLSESWDEARDIEVQASFWDRVRAPVVWLSAFVTLAAGSLGLWAAWRRRSTRGASAT